MIDRCRYTERTAATGEDALLPDLSQLPGTDLPTEQIALAELKPHPRNYQGHPDDQIAHHGLLKVESVDNMSLTLNLDMGNDMYRTLEIGPYFQDASQVFMEQQSTHMTLIETLTVLDTVLQEDYDYLTTQVTKFVQTFMP